MSSQENSNIPGCTSVKVCGSVFLLGLMLVGLFVGGAQPIAVGLFEAPWDKVAHAAFFFVLAWLLQISGVRPLWVVVIASMIGAADEIHQIFLPGRFAGWDDWLADMAGILFCVYWFKVRRNRFLISSDYARRRF